MKTTLTTIVLTTLVCGCRLYTVTQGDGHIYSDSGSVFCLNNQGECVEQYDTPTSETLIAQPAQGYAFRRWKGCNYKSLHSCEANITQTAIDDDLNWTITAVFEKNRPDVQPAEYTYNALGQRITKTVGGVTTVYQYDLEGKLIAELDAGGHPLRQHVYLEGAPIAMLERKTPESNTAVYYVHTDHLASPDLITNENGRIVADFESTPFGVPYINYSEIDYHLGFPGQYHDRETGLGYNYFRDYDPGLGRYIQSDPTGLAGGLNTYTYVGNNPVMYVDPTGEIGLPGAAVGGVIGGVGAFTGAVATGASFTDAAITGGLGALVGAGTGFFGGFGVGASFAIGGGTNILGQTIGNNIDGDHCNNTDINWWSVAGSAYGGAWAANITRGANTFWAAYHGWAPTTAASALGTAIGD